MACTTAKLKTWPTLEKWLEKAGLKDDTEALNDRTRTSPKDQINRDQTTPKMQAVKRVKIMWNFQIQTKKMVMANQPDIAVVDKHQRTTMVIDVVIPSNSKIRKTEHEKLEKSQGLKEELEKM